MGWHGQLAPRLPGSGVPLICPNCRAEILLADTNVSTDIALCRHCEKTFSFAELNQDQAVINVDLSQPPRGAWYRSQANVFEVGATTRSVAAFFLVPFTLVWAGGSMGGIYGTQIAHGKFELFQSLFGIPFLIGSVVLVSITLMTVFGKAVVRGNGDQGEVFIGAGPLGWTRRFQWNEINHVRSNLAKWQQNGHNLPLIELGGTKPIRFGSQLSEKRRDFMLAVLRRRVSNRL